MLSTLVPIAAAVAAVAAFALLSAWLEPWRPVRRASRASLAVMLALVAWAAFPSAGLMPEWYGVDLAWRLGLTWASERGLTHGREIFYTYGPLHFLSTRLPPWQAGWTLVLSDLVLWLTTLWIALRVARLHASPRIALGLLAVACAAGGPFASGHDLPFTGLWACWTLAVLAVRDRSSMPGAAALALAVLLTFVKLNTGLVAMALVVPLLTVGAWRAGHRRVTVMAPTLAAALLLLLAAGALPVDLPAYVKEGGAQVQGYIDTMALLPAEAGTLPWFVVGLAIVALAVLASSHRGTTDRTPVDVAASLVALAGVSLAYKQGFTRADPGHIGMFLRASLPFLWIPVGLGGPVRGPAFALAMACAVPLVALHEAHLRPAGLLQQAGARLAYVRGLPDLIRGVPDRHLWPVLPPSLRRAVTGTSVDVLPADAALLSDLPDAWHPRPAFQDIVVVTTATDAANERFYAGTSAPTGVLVRLGQCLAGSPCRQAESRTRLVVRDRFEPTHVGRDYAWLRRRPQPLGLQRVHTSEALVAWGQSIPLPTMPGAQWLLRAEVALSAPGRLARMLVAPPHVLIELARPGMAPIVEAASTSRLRGGVLVSPVVGSSADEVAWLAGRGVLPSTTAVTLKTPHPWGSRRRYA